MNYLYTLKRLIIAIIIILIPINIIFFILFYDGNFRYNFMRLIGESNNIITEFRLFRAIESRNFPLGVELLDKQLDRTQNLSPGNNKLLKSLYENVSYSFESTINIEDRDHFEKFLKRMVKLYPDIYSLRTWYAKTLENDKPEYLYEQLDQAIKILGTDSEAYRIGIKNAFKNKDINKLDEYCNTYYNNQLGGLKFADIPWVFHGIGIRSMTLELIDGDKKTFIKNNGISLNKPLEFEFLIPEKIKINNNFYLHLAITDGIELKIEKIRFYLEGFKNYEYKRDDIYFTTQNSFTNNFGSVLLFSKNKPEIIEFYSDKIQENIKADKIIFDMSFKRLNTSSSNICNNKINTD